MPSPRFIPGRPVWAALLCLLPMAVGQRIGPAEGEAIKAQLLANLNRHSQAQDGNGPLEPLGRTTKAASSMVGEEQVAGVRTRPGLAAALGDPFALFSAPVTPAQPLFPAMLSPLLLPTAPPLLTLAPMSPSLPSTADRRYQASTSFPAAVPVAPPSFPITHQSNNRTVSPWRHAANLIGEWRRKMYKLFKSARTGKVEKVEGTSIAEGAEEGDPVLLFGPPSSLIDARRANNLAKLFGVGASGVRRRANGTEIRERKHLHSAEIRLGEGRRTMLTTTAKTTTTSGAPPVGEEEDAYGDESSALLEEDKEHFEVVYVPALKRRKWTALAEEREKARAAVPHHHPPLPLPAATAAPPATLPLQFPTLLPPLSITLPSALSALLASSTTTAGRLPDGEYLKELENVAEDYVDEQERKMPCARRPPSQRKGCGEGKKLKTAKDVGLLEGPPLGFGPDGGDGEDFPWDENRDMCNSARLRALIQQTIVPANVEKSKRLLQQRAESRFGAFYNVICGTGFFSYIAHTDEFCLVSIQDVNCYVFSPVCSSQLSLASGIARHRHRHRRGRRLLLSGEHHLRAYLNRN